MEIRINKYAFVIGIFIAVAIAVFILAVLMVSGENNFFSKKFTLKVSFNNITGLKEGNNVWYSGMKVGTVEQIILKGNKLIEVVLSVEEKAHPFIFKNATARISSEGFVGNKIVVIEGGSEQLGVIGPGSYIKMASATGSDDLLATMSQSTNNLLAITENVLGMTQKISRGEGAIGKMIYDPALAVKLENSATSIYDATAGSKQVIGNLQQFLGRLNAQGSSVNKLLEDTVIFSQIKKSVVQMNTAVNRTEEFTRNLENLSAKLAGENNTVNLLLNDPKSTEDIKTMIENLRAASIRLNEDLEALQKHWLLRGVLKSKAEKQ